MAKLCACGRPLHYSDPEIRAQVERLIAELGASIPVTINGRTWLVQRHFIALHGLSAMDMNLFPEVPDAKLDI